MTNGSAYLPSSAASRHLLPEGEGLASRLFHVGQQTLLARDYMLALCLYFLVNTDRSIVSAMAL